MNMGWFNGRHDGHKHSHIDPATGRNKRDNTRRTTFGGPPRQNGRVTSRAEWRREQRTRGGRSEQPSRHGERRGWLR
jgi:hypothetical protein